MKQKVIAVLLCSFLIVTLTTGCQQKKKDEDVKKPSTKVPDNYISIKTVDDYKKLIDGTYKLTDNYILMADIDLTDYCQSNKCTPIGQKEEGFLGIFDGNNHTITGYYYLADETTNNVGFFSQLTTGVVKNLTLKDAKVEITKGNYVGLLVGLVKNGVIDNCHVSGSIHTKGESTDLILNVGLLAGATTSYTKDNENLKDKKYEKLYIMTQVSNSSSKGDIKIKGDTMINNVGGFIGQTSNGYHTTHTVLVTTYIEKSKSNVSINIESNKEPSRVAGFIALTDQTTIYQSYATGDINAPTSTTVGGFAGRTSETYIDQCFANTNITAKRTVGGLVAIASSSGYVHEFGMKNSYAKGSLTYNDEVKSSFSTAAGTLAYSVKDYLESVYADVEMTNLVKENDTLTAFCGNPSTVSKNGAFYNKEVVNFKYYDEKSKYTGLTKEEMKKKNSYEGFDFDKVWAIDENNSTPYLQFAKNVSEK